MHVFSGIAMGLMKIASEIVPIKLRERSPKHPRMPEGYLNVMGLLGELYIYGKGNFPGKPHRNQKIGSRDVLRTKKKHSHDGAEMLNGLFCLPEVNHTDIEFHFLKTENQGRLKTLGMFSQCSLAVWTKTLKLITFSCYQC